MNIKSKTPSSIEKYVATLAVTCCSIHTMPDTMPTENIRRLVLNPKKKIKEERDNTLVTESQQM